MKKKNYNGVVIIKHLNKQILNNLLYNFIHPYLIYEVEIWGNTFKTYLNPWFKIYKNILRIRYYKKNIFERRYCRFLNLLGEGLLW